MILNIPPILTAADFFPPAEQAVARAALLAQQQHKMTLHLLPVLLAISLKLFGQILFEYPLVTENSYMSLPRPDQKLIQVKSFQTYS